MTVKRLEIFVIVSIIAIIGIIYAFTQKPVLAPVANQQRQSQVADDSDTSANATSVNTNLNLNTQTAPAEVPTTTVTYQGVDGKNALELLQASHQVDVKHYSFGDLVTGIDGITPDSSHFWAMYVNGQFSQVGASAYQTKSTDSVKWEVDAVSPDSTK